jgi:hypothetical protein
VANSIAIKQVDDDEIYSESPGRFANKVTLVLNPAAGIAFILGLILMVVFVNKNLHYETRTSAGKAGATTTVTTTTTEPASPSGGTNPAAHSKP